MATMQALRGKAKELNIPAAKVRGAKTADALQALIMDAIMNGGGATKTPAKRTPAKKTTPARKTTTTKRPVRKAAAKPAPAPRKSTPVKKATPASQNGDAGRHVLVGIDYTISEGWNARPGSIPDQIIKSLRKHKGDRERVFNALVGNIWDFVGRRMKDGSKRTMPSAQDMLRYRISRTAWDFAMKTGQHAAATNRAEYGEGQRKNKTTPARSKATRTPAKRTATPTPTRKRAAAQKPVQRRTRPATPRKKTPVAKKKARR